MTVLTSRQLILHLEQKADHKYLRREQRINLTHAAPGKTFCLTTILLHMHCTDRSMQDLTKTLTLEEFTIFFHEIRIIKTE